MRRSWLWPLAPSVRTLVAGPGTLVGEKRRRRNDGDDADASAEQNVIEWGTGPEDVAGLGTRPEAVIGLGTGPEDVAGLGTGPEDDRGRPAVSVVIPAFNEEESIEWVLQQLPPWVYEVVLIDGLSTDRTEAIARMLRPDIVVVHQRQRGKGAALRAGFAAARGDIIVMMDADGSTDPWELDTFVAALEAGADFVKGSRIIEGGGSVDLTPIRRAGNLGFVVLVNMLYGSRFTDLCYGYCAFWRRHLDSLRLRADGFEIETELVLNAVRAGLDIREVPSVELPRRGGASNLRAFSDGRRVLSTILRHRLDPDSQAKTASSPIELVALDQARDSATVYLAVAQRPGAIEPTDRPRWLSAVRSTATSRNRSVAGTALPWVLSSVLLVRNRRSAASRHRAMRRRGATSSRRTRSSRPERARRL